MTEETSEGEPEDDTDPEADEGQSLEAIEKELQYAKAEIANIRQRSARDRSDLIKYGGASLARRLIPMIDGLSKAVETVEDSNSASVIEGVRMTLEGIRTAMASEGIVQIEALGEEFDPTRMEAIATVPCPEGALPDSVIEVIEQGFQMHDRVLRAARVVVAEGDS